MTKIKVKDMNNIPKMKHISSLKDCECGIVVTSNDYPDTVGNLIIKIDFEKDPYGKNINDWSVVFDLSDPKYYIRIDSHMWVRPVEEIEIRIIK